MANGSNLTRSMTQEVLFESGTFVNDLRMRRETIRAAIQEKRGAIIALETSVNDLLKVDDWCTRIIEESEQK